MKKVLVTGAAGFLGKPSLGLLKAKGYEVHAVSSRHATGFDGSVFWHKADLMEEGAVSALMEAVRPSHLLHFAWHTEHGKFWSSQKNFDWAAASMGLLKAFHLAGGKRAVFAGTCAEYEWGSSPLIEAITPERPASIYGKCKLSLLAMMQAYAKEAGLSAAWGRVFFVFGPGEKPQRLVPYIIRSLLSGKEAVCNNGGLIRDFLYVEDAADAFAHLLDSSVLGPVNIGSGQGIGLKALAEMIGQKTGAPHLLRFEDKPIGPDEAAELVADSGRLEREVGWCPSVGLSAGLERTIHWWRENENHD